MSNFTITANDMKNLKKLIASAINDEEDVDDAIDAWKKGLKAAPKGKGKGKNPEAKEQEKAIGKKPRAATAYLLYGKEMRPVFKKKNPDATFGELTQMVSEAWNKIKDDKKKSKKWHDLAAADKKRIEKELPAYEKKLKAYKSGSSDEENSSDEEEEKPKGKGKPAPKGKGKAVKKPVEDDESEEKSSEDEEEEKPKAGKGKPAPKGKATKKPVDEEEESDASEAKGTVDYKKMKLPELKALAKERGVDIKGKTKKDDIVAALEEVVGGDADAEDSATATEKDEEEEVEESEE